MTPEVVGAISLGLVFAIMAVRQIQFAGRARGADVSILGAAGFIVLAVVVTLPPVYERVDRALGSANITDLCARCLLVVGILCLSLGILRALGVRRGPIRRLFAIAGPIATTVLLCVSFSVIKAPYSSPHFMATFGGQPAAALYSTVEMVYVGVVMAFMTWACARFTHRMSTRTIRCGFWLVGLGSIAMLLLVGVTIALNLSHVAGAQGVVGVLSNMYSPTYLVAIVCLCVGAGLPPVSRAVSRRHRAAHAARLKNELEGIWIKLNCDKMTSSVYEPGARHGLGFDPLAVIHRLLIEIEDRRFYDPTVDHKLTVRDRVLLREGEKLVKLNESFVAA